MMKRLEEMLTDALQRERLEQRRQAAVRPRDVVEYVVVVRPALCAHRLGDLVQRARRRRRVDVAARAQERAAGQAILGAADAERHAAADAHHLVAVLR